MTRPKRDRTFSARFAIAWFATLAAVWSDPSRAHQVKVAENVGGTLHVEPNDVPRAGEMTTAWFALVRRGGEPIPLDACDCRLAIYSLPRQAEDDPILAPELTPIDVGRDRGIPSAEVAFPSIGRYELVLQGAAKDAVAFPDFDLSFEVTVAAGD